MPRLDGPSVSAETLNTLNPLSCQDTTAAAACGNVRNTWVWGWFAGQGLGLGLKGL